jgi:two-component system, sensor histidine kinase
MKGVGELERRVLIFAPTGRDAPMMQRVLADADIPAAVCADGETTTAELRRGAALLLVAEEALDAAAYRTLAQVLASQPSWSDLPVLVLRLVGGGSEAMATAVTQLGNVSLLDRPMPASTLVSAVRTALRARMRQYETRAAEQRKDAFIATLSHELRNPLAPIRNAVRVLRHQRPQSDGSAWAVDMIDRQVDHLKRLVDDLLDVARLTQGKVVLQPEPVDLARLVESAVEVCMPLIESRRHRLQLALPEQPIRLHGDPIRLAQVLSNLLDNAAKYTPEGGQIEVLATADAGFATIAVADNGIGFEPDAESVAQLFAIFSQAGPAAGAGGSGGLGIGLSLVKAFVELHGGSVVARSDGPGKGACFWVRLPLHAQADVAA